MKIHQLTVQKFYRIIFWIGLLSVLITSVMTLFGNLSSIKIHASVFELRLDYLVHFGVYFLIGLYFLAGKVTGISLFDRNPVLKFLFIILFLAVFTELVQLVVPARSFNPTDMIANVAGVASGITCIILIKRREK